MTLLLAAVYGGGRSFVLLSFGVLRFTSCQAPVAGFVGDRLGIAVEFVDEIPRQERLREFDAGRIHVCSRCGLPYVWLISCRLTPSFVPSWSSSSATFSASSRAEATLDIGHRRLQSRLQALRHQCATQRRLGAHHYVDSQSQDPAEELTRLGGARVILATVTSGKAMTATIGGLGVDGKLVVLGAAHEPLEVSALALIGAGRSIAGWPSGRSIDSQDTLAFSVLTGVRSMNELLPLDRAGEAYDRMMSGKARFRVVLTTGA